MPGGTRPQLACRCVGLLQFWPACRSRIRTLQQVPRGGLAHYPRASLPPPPPPSLGTVLQEFHPLVAEAWAAANAIYSAVFETPLEPAPWLADAVTAGRRDSGPCCVHLKMETRQASGSFKARGAAHKLLGLSREELERGVVASSTGNHALAVVHAAGAAARAAGLLRPRLTLYLPTTASPAKLAKLRAAGAEVVLHGVDCVEAEAEARRVAAQRGQVYVSPYNDLKVGGGEGGGEGCGGVVRCLPPTWLAGWLVEQGRLPDALAGCLGRNDLPSPPPALTSPPPHPGVPAPAAVQVAGGQGTLGLELLMQIERGHLDTIYIPVGGGGLASGVAAVLKAADPDIHVVGCQPEASDVMRRSVAAGRVVAVPWRETLSEATAGGLEEGAVTLEPCTRFVDEVGGCAGMG